MMMHVEKKRMMRDGRSSGYTASGKRNERYITLEDGTKMGVKKRQVKKKRKWKIKIWN